MNFGHVDTRDLRPGLVGVRIIIQELVAEHQCHCKQPELAAWLATYCRIELLESVNEEKGK